METPSIGPHAFAPVSVRAVMKAARRTVRWAGGIRRIEVSVDAPCLRVQLDAVKLHQILVILLRSLISRSVSENKIRMIAVAGGDRLEVDVLSARPLFPGEHLVHCFREFSAHPTRHTLLHGGAGLNLAIAVLIARMLGGDLVDTEDSAGFRLILP